MEPTIGDAEISLAARWLARLDWPQGINHSRQERDWLENMANLSRVREGLRPPKPGESPFILSITEDLRWAVLVKPGRCTGYALRSVPSRDDIIRGQIHGDIVWTAEVEVMTRSEGDRPRKHPLPLPG